MSYQIHTYAELRRQIREALRKQHSEWIEANGKSSLCDSYEARFSELLSILTQRKESGTGELAGFQVPGRRPSPR
jgi:hypothetical protein